jgi:long-chain acyl-CoA synthetase
LSNGDFRTAAEEVALGLISLGLERGDRIAFVMQSNSVFGIADMGCLLAGLVDVPIDLTQTIENILFILNHTQAKLLLVSNLDLLYQLAPYLQDVPLLQTVIVAEVEHWQEVRAGWQTAGREQMPPHGAEVCLHVAQFLEGQVEPASSPVICSTLQFFSLEEVRERGRQRWSVQELQQLRTRIAPADLATILYIASETKQPRGVMLTHASIAADILAAFSSYPNLGTGAAEVALLFLPLTHIFTRAFFYGHLAYGHSIYFSDPNHVGKHLKTVHPTFVITVPRLLEKVYERILDQGKRLSKFDRLVFDWTLHLAQRYEIGQVPSRLYALKLKLADRLVFAKWRSVFGDRLKALICGGAALKPELANLFSAAGIPVLQGYGLTETSAVLCYNRGSYHRAGTVGVPIPGVEITIAADGEILVRGACVMQGYYRDAEATDRALDADGWMHTGDLGEVTEDGLLKITGVKKSLFKLSTGKYVSPLLLEQELDRSPLIAHAITVGANHKFCGMLIFPNWDRLRIESARLGVDLANDETLQHPLILVIYQNLIDQANCHLPYWSTVRKFRLIAAELTPENGLLQPDGTVNRSHLLEQFAAEIQSLYGNDADRRLEATGETEQGDGGHSSLTAPTPPAAASPASCPAYAKSLMHY